jgi:N-acetylornithine carbamoyltransferase
VETVIDVALKLKRDRALGVPHALLRDKVLAMLFFFSSTRTRSSFEAGIAQLGGHGAFIDSTRRRSATGTQRRRLGRFTAVTIDGIAIRQCDWDFGNQYINEVAKASRVPVLNMQ